MEFKNALIVVRDMELSKSFYKRTLGLRVTVDFGANVTLTGGVCLQTEDTWKEIAGVESVVYGGGDAELYFEEDDFDGFLRRLETLDADALHPVKEHPWGQRAVRFYDPDRHVIEVGENLRAVCRRFLNSGLTPEQTALRMDVPLDYVTGCAE